MTPFIKYIGGKRRLAKEILPLFPTNITKYIEPFCGGCAIAFALNHPNSFLSDIKLPIIRFYKSLKDNPEKTYKLYNKINSKVLTRNYYKYIKNLINHPWCLPFEYASYFIYLNKNSYFAIIKSKNNKVDYDYFNHNRKHLIDIDNFYKVCDFLKKSKVDYKNYKDIEINKDSFYYFDPPYLGVGSLYNDDIKFNNRLFFEFVKKINKAGARFLMSNSDSEVIREYFKEFNIKSLKAKHQNHRTAIIKENNNKSVGEGELVIFNY